MGIETLRLAPERAPDLVVRDTNLPGIDDFEVAQGLRVMGAHAHPAPSLLAVPTPSCPLYRAVYLLWPLSAGYLP
jgi:hypothetical protein